MNRYLIRRFLLLIPTMLGITMLVFSITRFVPGGPLDRMLQEAAKGADQGGKAKTTSVTSNMSGMSEEQLESLEEEYALDQPIWKAYLQWLGAMPRENFHSKAELKHEAQQVDVLLKSDGRFVEVKVKGGRVESVVFKATQQAAGEEAWFATVEDEAARQARFMRRNGTTIKPPQYAARVNVFQKKYYGLLQGNLGKSLTYQDSVWDMMKSRIPVAVYFGLLAAMISYGVSIPLGVLKALKHRTAVDNISSILIFVGYSIPGFALGAVLLIYMGARWQWFPMSGIVSAGFENLSFIDQIKDLGLHTVLPLTCYVVGSFAMLTMMVKNNLMDQLAADYVRTALSKGSSFNRAVFRHAFQNSIIPVVSSLGSIITVVVSGSILVERMFDIQGFGMLQYQAIVDRDIQLIMGTVTLSAFLMLLGNIISDCMVAMIDPRIRFND